LSLEQTASRAAIFSVLGNTLLALLKGAAGILGNSFALIADAVESTTDIFSSLLVLAGIKFSQKPPDSNHPYGHGKVEPLITFMVVVFLVLSASFIAFQAVRNIQSPQEAPATWTLWVLGGIILWKEASFRYVDRKSKQTGSTALKADAWHHRSDAITSVVAFFGILASIYLGEGFESLEDWAALFAAGFILYNSFLIFRPALGEIMDEHQYDDQIQKIRKSSAEVKGVIDTEKCFIRKSGMKYFIDLHIIVDAEISVRAGHDIAHELKSHLMSTYSNIENILIHVEPEGADHSQHLIDN
jgi:cation diffusion facilitator family transporter